jgi:hypothetical protein
MIAQLRVVLPVPAGFGTRRCGPSKEVQARSEIRTRAVAFMEDSSYDTTIALLASSKRVNGASLGRLHGG